MYEKVKSLKMKMGNDKWEILKPHPKVVWLSHNGQHVLEVQVWSSVAALDGKVPKVCLTSVS